MVTKTVRFCMILWMTFCLSGCMSALTYTAPLKSKLVNGEKTVGEIVSYEYACSVQSNKVYVEKKPMHKESIMKMRYARKELRCFSCALGEMVLYGLGLFDMMRAYAIIEESKLEVPLAEFETGKLLAGGPLEPAADEVVFIDNQQAGLHRIATTDASGVVDLDKVLVDIPGSMNLKIHLASNASRSFRYLYEPSNSYSHFSGRN